MNDYDHKGSRIPTTSYHTVRRPRVSRTNSGICITCNKPNSDVLIISMEDHDDAYRVGTELIEAAIEAADKRQSTETSSSSTDIASQSPQE